MITILMCLVVSIADGDTLTVLCNGTEQVKIRLAEIDAPEKKQPFGNRSKQSLSGMCFLKQARIKSQTKDRYGRTVARVICDGVDANEEQVKRGMAWVYDRYVRDRSLYAIQDKARASKVGLWADDKPVKPWAYRRANKR
jgi:endonuclease YncB( thermonuclease family)